MSPNQPPIPGFKAIFTTIGVLYVILASSVLVRGVEVMRDFAVPESLISSPVFQDFFSFFYQLMAAVGVLTMLFGHVTRERRAQVIVASVFCVLNLLLAIRDLSTSDSRFGSHLYRGEATLVFVSIDLALALIFGWVALRGLTRTQSTQERSNQ